MSSAENEFDIEEIKRNAYAQGVDLREIAVFYEGLTPEEKNLMMAQDLITHDNGDTVIAKFTEDGEVLFSGKVKGIHYLAA